MTLPVERGPHWALAMTLAQYAAVKGKHPREVKSEYARWMRGGGVTFLPAVSQWQAAGGVVKFCLPVAGRDGTRFESESVILPMRSYGGRTWYTLCVSSQVGCRMGCTFCETARMGWVHNLTAAEIVCQWLAAHRLVQDTPASRYNSRLVKGIRNVVFMGMGEPLDNFDNVVQAIRVLTDPAGAGLPLSRVTLSTVGRIDGLRRLAALGWSNLRIAVSLNAPSDELRERLMPINKGMPLADLQRVLLEYPLPPRGRFLIEYVLIRGVNDDLRDADAVAAWCRPLPCTVNLIPYNPQRQAAYETPAEERVLAFLRRLRTKGVFAKRRLTQGLALMGACGQLGNARLRAQGGFRPARVPES